LCIATTDWSSLSKICFPVNTSPSAAVELSFGVLEMVNVGKSLFELLLTELLFPTTDKPLEPTAKPPKKIAAAAATQPTAINGFLLILRCFFTLAAFCCACHCSYVV